LRDALRLGGRLLRGRFGDDPCLLYVSGRQFTVETSPPMLWQADGELLGTTPFTVEVEPKAVRLIVPHHS
jgi:diacylglycerol kinase family enzyme